MIIELGRCPGPGNLPGVNPDRAVTERSKPGRHDNAAIKHQRQRWGAARDSPPERDLFTGTATDQMVDASAPLPALRRHSLPSTNPRGSANGQRRQKGNQPPGLQASRTARKRMGSQS